MAETRFHALLKAKILEVIANKSADLAGGVAKDYTYYKNICGQIEGLREALSLCDDIEREFD